MTAANMRHVLASGREIVMTALHQEAVYYGLLEGLPTREMNQETIDDLREKARERTGREPYVIEPVQTPIAYDGTYAFGEPAKLPEIACVADFTSRGRDIGFFSELTVIWFQDDYAFPLSEAARAALLCLDWDTHAPEQEW